MTENESTENIQPAASQPVEPPGAAKLSDPERWVEEHGDFLFKYRNYLFPAVFLILVVATSHRPWTSEPVDDILDIVGVVMAALGQALRALVDERLQV